MTEVLIKVAPSVYAVLEAIIKVAIQCMEADAGRIFHMKRADDRLLVNHQCLFTDHVDIFPQYREGRPVIDALYQRLIDDGKMIELPRTPLRRSRQTATHRRKILW
jgi:hypothetical protein